ncbi:hypothetical protein ABPG75_004139 [Micractinium tetrahymenae]
MPPAVPPVPAPGAYFLRRRLARAEAIPPAERPPEVAAFVASVALLRDACRLLPLTAAGRPALAWGPATERSLLLGLVRTAHAGYICPLEPACDLDYRAHGAAYEMSVLWPHVPRASAPSAGRDIASDFLAAAAQLEPLQEALSLRSLVRSDLDLSGRLRAASAAVALLEQPAIRRTIDRQLAEVQAGAEPVSRPPLLQVSAAQLLYAAHCDVVVSAAGVTAAARDSRLFGEVPTEVPTAMLRNCQAIERLEPDNPRGLIVAASAASAIPGQEALAARLLQRTLCIAREHSSDFYTAFAASLVAVNSLQRPGQLELTGAVTAEVREAVQQAEAALARCKRLLPDWWISALKMNLSTPAAAAVQGADPLQNLQAVLAAEHRMCAGCNRAAEGLRPCARCRRCYYCRVSLPKAGG